MLGPSSARNKRYLRVTPRRRQLLVEDAAAELRSRAERLAQHLERLAMGHEHERLLVRLTPALRLRQQPQEARIGSIHRLRLLPQLGLVRPQHRLQRCAGGQRPPNAIESPPPGYGIVRTGGVRRPSLPHRHAQGHRGRRRGRSARRERGRRKINRHRHARRQSPNIHPPRRARARR